ncbi:LysR family transcriptional regulator [Hydrogenophaga laconesensis]|uniref:DNA-binding transcriptional LysR family regulator n=1 Tax=Hydrogenophaga laconesensis TaxID=1805971 RepID=A0ABU1V578_9BURK|nr:LysR family transcriptional regulator [Hydrogenophaga laconesensis]MDR7092597.1 DNA-binding transcriptional LysR family regulator [Hydrogenophaga laconesensis]
MNLRQIEVFRATMLTGSTADAARLLHVSQPGISRMIGHIELQLGLRLFERGKGRLKPTPEAHALYAEVEHVYRGVRRIDERAQALKSGGGLALRVLASPSTLLEIVPRAVASLSADYPDSMIYLESQLVRDMVRLLAIGEADVGISNLPIDHPLLVSEVVGSWSLSCVFQRGHRFEQETSVSISEIVKERLIAFSPDTPQGRLVAEHYPRTLDTGPRRIEVRSGQVACALAEAGAGVAVVDNLTARAWRKDQLSFRPIKRSPRTQVFRVRNPAFPGSVLEDGLVERIRQGFRAMDRPGQ